MATPVVSGLSALMLSVNPDLTAQQLMDLFTSTAVDLGDPGKVTQLASSRVVLRANTNQAFRIRLSGTVALIRLQQR